MERTKTKNYSGYEIFMMDFSNTKNEQEITPIIEQSKTHIRSKPFNSVLAVTNMTNMFFSKSVASNFTKFVKDNKPYMKKSSVYGMSGLATFVFNSIMKVTGRDIRSFKTETEAINFTIK